MSAATAVIMTQVPIELHKEVKRIAKRRKNSIVQFVRDAIELRVDYFKTKENEEKYEAKDQKRKPSAVTALDQRPTVEIPVEAPVDRLAPLFEKYAKKIMAVYDKPQEVAVVQQEAFSAIRKFAPLTYRDDEKISERLESLIAAKASLDYEAEAAAEPSGTPPPIMARSLLNSAPAITAPSGLSSLATPEVFALLKQMLTPQGQPVEEDPLAGKMINAARVRTKSVLGGEDE